MCLCCFIYDFYCNYLLIFRSKFIQKQNWTLSHVTIKSWFPRNFLKNLQNSYFLRRPWGCDSFLWSNSHIFIDLHLFHCYLYASGPRNDTFDQKFNDSVATTWQKLCFCNSSQLLEVIWKTGKQGNSLF